jgi:hypothetical protein
MPILSVEKALRSLRKTPVILSAILRDVDQERAASATDGPNGWSALFVVCHLRDYEDVYIERARLMLTTDNPHFQNIDHLALTVTNRYAEQNLRDVFDAFVEKRRTFVRLLEGLDEDQWARIGTSATVGECTVLELAINVALHDINHIEQIVRALELEQAVI